MAARYTALTEPPDSGDMDALEDMVRSPGYAMLRKRIEDTIVTRQRALESDMDENRTNVERGSIRALRLVLTLPAILKTEITESIEQWRHENK